MHRLSDDLFIELAVVCEDVREEKGSKISLLGVFTGDILVAELPAQIRIAFYFALRSTNLEDRRMKIRFAHDDSAIVEAEAVLEFPKEVEYPRHFANLLIPLGLMKFEKDTWLRVSFQLEGHEWVQVLEKFVFTKGATSPSPTASEPPSLQSPSAAPQTA